MRFASILIATACAILSSGVKAQNQPLPWSGRGQDITVDTLTDEFLTHILTQRKSGTGNPADYVTVTQDGRSPGFNDDTGMITIAVDNDAIFGGQTNFRRSELVQNVAAGSDTTFFRVSVKKDLEWLNKYSWQVIFPESHLFEIRIDASVDPPMIIWYTGGSLDVKWETEFVLGTWYNFGIAVSGSALTLYESENDAGLAQVASVTNSGGAQSSFEFHFGLLTLSNDGSEPVMVDGKQDILAFNGVSVEDGIPSDVSSGASTTPTTTTAAPATTTAAPATTTTAPATTTSAPITTTAAPAASEADDEYDEGSTSASDTADDADDEYETEAPAATTSAPATTTAAPAATTTAPATTTATPTVTTGPVSCRRKRN